MSFIPYQNRIDQMLSSQGDGSGTFDMAVDGVAITGATTADPVVCTAASHGYSDGDWIWIDGATGTTEINGLRQVTASDTNTFQLLDESGAAIASAGTFGGTVDSQPAMVIKPAANETYKLARMNGYACDDAAIDVDGFLSIAALTNGVNVKVYDGSTGTYHSLLAKPITTWLDWSLVTGGSDTEAEVASNKTIGGFRWTFGRNAENGIGNTNVTLRGANGDMLVVYTQDDLAALSLMRLSVQGVK